MLTTRFTTYNRETGETFMLSHDGKPESVLESHDCVDDWFEDFELGFSFQDAFVMHRMIAAESDAREMQTSVGEAFFRACEEDAADGQAVS